MKVNTLAASAFLATTATAIQDTKPAGAPAPGAVKVVNRCNYDVYLFNVVKQIGCQASNMVTLKKGESWSQTMGYYYDETKGDDAGVSVKLSKYPTCGGQDITQLEYKLKYDASPAASKYNGNYLDMSFVDCQRSGDCPGFKDGFFLKSGNHDTDVASATSVSNCPIYSVANEIQAAKVSYINPDDVQTKFCPIQNDLSLYLCGSQAPGAADQAPASSSSSSSSSAPAPSSAAPSSSSPSPPAQLPTSIPKESSSDVAIAKAAAVTSAPAPQPPKIKTVVEYYTVFVDAPAPVKRHTHGRRHQRIHA